MELTLRRIALRDTYTIGRLFIDGQYFCDTLEDKVRNLSYEPKVAGQTAIPYGRYDVTLNIRSPKFAQKAAYQFCGGRLPRLMNVPHFEGVLIHIGNTAADSSGCILVGCNDKVGYLSNSTTTFRKLYEQLSKAANRGEKIKINIVAQ